MLVQIEYNREDNFTRYYHDVKAMQYRSETNDIILVSEVDVTTIKMKNIRLLSIDESEVV